jgi:hypothetical protein
MKPILGIAAIVVCFTAGCSGDGPTDPGSQQAAFIVRVDLPRGSLYVNDSTLARIAEVRSGGDTIAVPATGIRWTTDNPDLLSVSGSGWLRGVGYGIATLKAEWESHTASVQVRVAGTLHTEHVRVSEIWRLEHSPHVVDSILALEVGGEGELATLDVEAGTVVLFREGASIVVGRAGRGALIADGQDAMIRFEAEDSLAPAGAWRGLEITGNEQSILRNAAIRQCGSLQPPFPPYPACLMIRSGVELGEPTITLTDVSVRHALAFGFVIEEGVEVTAESARVSVENVEGYAGFYPPSQLATFPYGGSFRDLMHASIILQGDAIAADTIAADLEWSNPGVAWLLISDIIVEGVSAPVVTLSPGLDLRLDHGRGLVVGATRPGRIVAGSLEGPPVRMRVGTFHGGGGWGGLYLGPHSGPSSLTNVQLEDCAIECLVVAGNGTDLTPAVLAINVEITRPGARGLSLLGGGHFAEGSRNLTVTGSLYSPVIATVGTAWSIPPGSYAGNGDDRFELWGGEVREDAVWRDHGIPYLLSEGLGVENSAILTLEPGTQLEFPPGSSVYVGQLSPGTLRAIGTAERQIVFTSSLPEPIPGTWQGLSIQALGTTETLLEHVIVEWGGTPGRPSDGGSGGAILIARDLGPIVRNVLIRDAGTCAIRRDHPEVWTTDFTAPALGNRFENNHGPDQCGPDEWR